MSADAVPVDRPTEDPLHARLTQNREHVLNLLSSRPAICTDVFLIVDCICLIDKNQMPTFYPMPAELSVVLYSLKDGIFKELHQFIDAGPIKLGNRATFYSFQKKHDLSEQDPDIMIDPRIVMENIVPLFEADNLCRDGDTVPIFCMAESSSWKVEFCMQWLKILYQNSRGCVLPEFMVCSLELLVIDLAEIANVRMSPKEVHDNFSSSAFEWTPNIKCDYHNEKESALCSKHGTIQACYSLSAMLSPLFNVVMTERHLPVQPAGALHCSLQPVLRCSAPEPVIIPPPPINRLQWCV